MMVVTCSNSAKVGCPEFMLPLDSALTTKTVEIVMNNSSYEGLVREYCIHGASSMFGILMSACMQPLCLDDLEEAIREGKRGMTGSNIRGE
jgi:hypothetical protein